jgi:hypothetical protein
MKICTVIVTRSKSCSVKTLHTILKLNIECIQKNVQNEILYVNDDPFEKIEMIKKCLTKCDRLFFVDFGINVDEVSIKQIFEPHEDLGVLVFPGVKYGINWDLFKNKVREGSTEPVSQMGLNFDTIVGRSVSKNIHKVEMTQARAWVMMTKVVIKNGIELSVPNMFDKILKQGIKIFAFTAAKLTMTYPHECFSNILNAAGVKSN